MTQRTTAGWGIALVMLTGVLTGTVVLTQGVPFLAQTGGSVSTAPLPPPGGVGAQCCMHAGDLTCLSVVNVQDCFKDVQGLPFSPYSTTFASDTTCAGTCRNAPQTSSAASTSSMLTADLHATISCECMSAGRYKCKAVFTNLGPNNAPAVTFKVNSGGDTIDKTSATGLSGGQGTGNETTWAGALPVGAVATATAEIIDVTASANTVWAAANITTGVPAPGGVTLFDPNPSNNVVMSTAPACGGSSSSASSPGSADLYVLASICLPAPGMPGLYYHTFTLGNSGPAPATNVSGSVSVTQDTIFPPSISPIGDANTTAIPGFLVSPQMAYWSNGMLAPGDSVQFKVAFDDTSAVPGTITVAWTTGSFDPNLFNNTLTMVTTGTACGGVTSSFGSSQWSSATSVASSAASSAVSSKTSSAVSSTVSSTTSSAVSSVTSSHASSITSSAVSSHASSAVSSHMSSAVSSNASSTVSSHASSTISSHASSQTSSHTSSHASSHVSSHASSHASSNVSSHTSSHTSSHASSAVSSVWNNACLCNVSNGEVYWFTEVPDPFNPLKKIQKWSCMVGTIVGCNSGPKYLGCDGYIYANKCTMNSYGVKVGMPILSSSSATSMPTSSAASSASFSSAASSASSATSTSKSSTASSGAGTADVYAKIVSCSCLPGNSSRYGCAVLVGNLGPKDATGVNAGLTVAFDRLDALPSKIGPLAGGASLQIVGASAGGISWQGMLPAGSMAAVALEFERGNPNPGAEVKMSVNAATTDPDLSNNIRSTAPPSPSCTPASSSSAASSAVSSHASSGVSSHASSGMSSGASSSVSSAETVYGCCKGGVYIFGRMTDAGFGGPFGKYAMCVAGGGTTKTYAGSIMNYMTVSVPPSGRSQAVIDTDICENSSASSSSKASSAASSVTSSMMSSAHSSSASSVSQKYKRLRLIPNPGCVVYAKGDLLNFTTVYSDLQTCLIESPKVQDLFLCKVADGACQLLPKAQCGKSNGWFYPADIYGKNSNCPSV